MKYFKYRSTPILVLVWFGALWMLHQEVVSQSFLSKDAKIDINDGALIMRQDIMGMYLANQKIGYKNFVLKEDSPEDELKLPGRYFVYESVTFMRIRALGTQIDMQMRHSGEVNEDLTMRRFSFQYNASGQEVNQVGTVENGGVQIVSKSDGYSATKTIPIKTAVYPADLIHLVLAQDGFEVGTKKTYPVFEPSLTLVANIYAHVEGKETIVLPDDKKVPAFKVDLEFQGLHTKIWIDTNGDVYKEISQAAGLQFTAMRETEEQAMDMTFISEEIGPTSHLDEQLLDLVESSKVSPDVVIENPEQTREMEIKLTGADREQILTDGMYQTLVREEGDAFVIKVKKMDYDSLASTLPEGTPPFENDDPNVETFLQEDLYIQPKHPKIRGKAFEVTAGAKNSWEASEKTADWLYESINKEIRGTIPTSIEVLNTMRGDCNEHSTLFAAMARAVGIPCKVIAGLVYQRQSVQGPGFYYHAWNEVYLNGVWYPIDATLNRIRMDAAHIKLAEGEMESQAKIVNLIGNIDIEILSHN